MVFLLILFTSTKVNEITDLFFGFFSLFPEGKSGKTVSFFAGTKCFIVWFKIPLCHNGVGLMERFANTEFDITEGNNHFLFTLLMFKVKFPFHPCLLSFHSVRSLN